MFYSCSNPFNYNEKKNNSQNIYMKLLSTFEVNIFICVFVNIKVYSNSDIFIFK